MSRISRIRRWLICKLMGHLIWKEYEAEFIKPKRPGPPPAGLLDTILLENARNEIRRDLRKDKERK